MKLCLVSDLHGKLIDIPPCEILLIGGDLCPLGNHGYLYQAQWLGTTFKSWLEKVPAKKIVAVAGNHDFVFETRPDLVPKLPWTYLEDSFVVHEGIKIYGSPWQPIFYNWAFNLSEPKLKEKWKLIPDDINVLLLHGPPHTIGDYVPRGENVGSVSLLKKIESLKELRLVVFGHIHPNYGVYEHNGITLINASSVNKYYEAVNPPLIWEYK